MKGGTKPSGFGSVSGAQMKTDSGGDGGVSGVWKMRWWVVERADRYPHHSVRISDSNVDNIVTFYRLRHTSGRPADDT